MKQKALSFQECVKLMRKHDPQLREDGFHSLLPRAHEYVDELIAEFRSESDHGLRCWLLELIGEARSMKAFPILVEFLDSDNESLRRWAVHGLRQLATKDARRALWEARVRKEPNEW